MWPTTEMRAMKERSLNRSAVGTDSWTVECGSPASN